MATITNFDGFSGRVDFENGEHYEFYLEGGEVLLCGEDAYLPDADDITGDILDCPIVAETLAEEDRANREYKKKPYAYHGVSERDFY